MRRLFILLSIILLAAPESEAQFFAFGRNKVQWEVFNWRVLKTDHFDIYYYQGMENVAEAGAKFAEDAFNTLKQEFDHIPGYRIPLIFYNTSIHFQQTNTTPGFIPEGVGGFFEFLKGRVVIPYMGSVGEFKHVIIHELTHVFMVTKAMKSFKDRRISSEGLPPLWYVEGISEYYSTEWDAQAEMVMRDAVYNGLFTGLEYIDRIYGSFLMYKEGQSFMRFLDKQYGKEKIQMILENAYLHRDFDKVLEVSLGEKFEKIARRWEAFEKEKYFPVVEKTELISVASDMLTERGFSFDPTLYRAGDKNYIFYIANVDGYSSIYKMEVNDKFEKKDDPEIFLRGEKTEEFEAFHLLVPSMDISSDGKLAFVTKSGPTDVIHFYSAESGDKLKTFQRDEFVSISSPSFSDGAAKLVFSAVDSKGFSDIFILDYDSDAVTRLTNDLYEDIDPVFGNKDEIIFVSDRTAGRNKKKKNVFSVNASDLKIRYLTNLDADCSTSFVTDDKKQIYFTSDIDGVYNLYSMPYSNVRQNSLTKHTKFYTSIFTPSLVDTGKILFSGFERFSFRLYSKTLDVINISDTIRQIKMDLMTADDSWPVKKISKETAFEKYQYEKEYTLEYAQSQVTTDPVFGTRGGAVVGISDLLSNDKFYFLLYNTAQVQSEFLESFNVDLFRLRQGQRTNYGYGIFHYSGRRYDLRDPDLYYYERSFGSYFVMHFPLSVFDRIETSASLANSDKEIISGVIERKAILMTNVVSYVHDNSLWGPSGPIDGSRFRLSLGYTSDIKYSNVNYFSFIFDYRKYLRLGMLSALAFRGSLYYNEGKEARRYFMGGSWSLRGYHRWSIRGEKMWLSSVELRLPFIDLVYVRLPFIDLGLGNIRTALFFDAGSAWDEKYTETLGSIGFGFRFNLFNILVLRYDMGKKIENNFTQLQPGLFYQFFFGWDF